MRELTADGTAAAPPQALLERLKDYGQEDAFALWEELSAEERHLLVKDIEVLLFLFRFSLRLREYCFDQFLVLRVHDLLLLPLSLPFSATTWRIGAQSNSNLFYVSCSIIMDSWRI